jgi:hypothetical protein
LTRQDKNERTASHDEAVRALVAEIEKERLALVEAREEARRAQARAKLTTFSFFVNIFVG